MPAYAPRRGARCECAAVRYRDALVDTQLVVVPLCRLHFRKVLTSSDPVAVVRSSAALIRTGGRRAQRLGGNVRA